MLDALLQLAFGLALLHWLVSLAAALRFRPPPPGPGPAVAVLVPAFNEAQVIEGCLRRLAACDPPPHEVVVVDDGSTDATALRAEAARPFLPQLRVIRQPNRGKAAALDAALAATRAPVVAVLDADTWLARDALGHLAAPFRDPTVGAVAGRVRVGQRGQLVEALQAFEYVVAIDFARRAQSALNAIVTVPGACGAFRRATLTRSGGFASPTLAEDTDATLRVHGLGDQRVVYQPRAIALTEAPAGWRALFRQRCRWTTGNLQCLWRHRRLLGRRGWLGLWALPGFLVGHLAMGSTPLVLALAVGFAAHAPALAVIWSLLHLGMELTAAGLALRADGRRLAGLGWLVPQRLAFAGLYVAVFAVVARRLARQRIPGWQKLERLGLPGAPASAHLEHQLAPRPLGLQPPVSLGRLVEGQHGVDDRP